ncbi:hypothetical protein HHI36_014595 [Cryptolaemus montrouzieri]|uniref:Uncharacterized protein n=1 Tax=Cryptolaemus montrouzieri TaxID=559131 RepID=A0ABD2N313_9CUCU
MCQQGQPWPANAAGYANFSQLPGTINTEKLSVLSSSPGNSNLIIQLDLSKPGSDLERDLQEILSAQLKDVKPSSQQVSIPVTLNITPPLNAGSDFIEALQNAIKATLSKLVPFAETSLRLSLTKTSDDIITNVSAVLNINVPAANQEVSPTLPLSNGVDGSSSQIINLDLSKSGSSLTTDLERILSSRLINIKPSDQQQSIPLSLDITPPANAGQDFIIDLQNAFKDIVSKLVPFASSSLKLMTTKTSTGIITNVVANLNINVPSTVPKIPPTLPPSSVPEIDLTQSSAGLQQDLQTIILKELSQKSYDPNSVNEQNFDLSFSVLPPAGSTPEYVKLNILSPLQKTLRQIDPNAKITAVNVKTLQNGGKVLRQVVNFNIKIKPPSEPKITENVVNIPEVDLNKSDSDMAIVLQDILDKSVTKQEIEQQYITLLEQKLKQVDPSSKISSISVKLSADGNFIITVYLVTNPSINSKVISEVTSKPAIITSTTEKVNLKPQDQATNIVKPTFTPKITDKEIEFPEINLNQPNTDTNIILKNIVDTTISLGKNRPTTIAIPFKIKPTSGATEEQIENQYIVPLAKKLKQLDPSFQTSSISGVLSPDGNYIITVYVDTNPSSNKVVKPENITPEDENIAIPVISSRNGEIVATVAPSKETEITNNAIQIPVDLNKPSTTLRSVSITTLKPQTTTSKAENIATPAISSRNSEIVAPSKQIQIPKNAIETPSVDFTKPGVSLADLQKILNDELSPITNPNDGKSKVLAIPFKISPPAGATPEQIEQNVVAPLEDLLRRLEPTGEVLTFNTHVLPDGKQESVIYFEVPSVKNSKTYEDIFEKNAVSILSTKAPPTIQIPQGSVETPAINLESSKLNLITLSEDILQRLEKALQPDEQGSVPSSQSKYVGFPFIIPATSKNLIPEYVQTISTALKNLEPSGQIIPQLVPKVLPNGEIEFVVYLYIPSVTSSYTYKNILTKPSISKLDINLDRNAANVDQEVSEALVKGLGLTAGSNYLNNRNKGKMLDLDIYIPSNEIYQGKKYLDKVEQELKKLEPTGKVESARVNSNVGKNQPDAELEFLVPSVSNSKTLQYLKDAITIPSINLNQPGLNLSNELKILFENNLKNLKKPVTNGNQYFNLNFKLNPLNKQGSITQITSALKALDPSGKIISSEIKTGADGLDYLDIIYLISNLRGSNIYKKATLKIVQEAIVNIDARQPFRNLLEKIIAVVGSAEDYVTGAKEGQIVTLPLNFKITNSEGMTDKQVSQIVSALLPQIRGYINQILPDGKIISLNTNAKPDSDDVILAFRVRTPYDPDDEIEINNVVRRPVPTTTTTTTTTTQKPRRRFSLFNFGI